MAWPHLASLASSTISFPMNIVLQPYVSTLNLPNSLPSNLFIYMFSVCLEYSFVPLSGLLRYNNFTWETLLAVLSHRCLTLPCTSAFPLSHGLSTNGLYFYLDIKCCENRDCICLIHFFFQVSPYNGSLINTTIFACFVC